MVLDHHQVLAHVLDTPHDLALAQRSEVIERHPLGQLLRVDLHLLRHHDREFGERLAPALARRCRGFASLLAPLRRPLLVDLLRKRTPARRAGSRRLQPPGAPRSRWAAAFRFADRTASAETCRSAPAARPAWCPARSTAPAAPETRPSALDGNATAFGSRPGRPVRVRYRLVSMCSGIVIDDRRSYSGSVSIPFGAQRLGRRTFLGSIPSSSNVSWSASSRTCVASGSICGRRNRPRSRRLYQSTNPPLSHVSTFARSPRRETNTNRCPENAFSSAALTSAPAHQTSRMSVAAAKK